MVKTKPQGSKMKSVPSISQQYEALFFSMMMKPQYTKITGTCNLCSSSRQQQVLNILRFILDRIKKCLPMDYNSNRRRIDRRFISQPQYRYQQSMELP
jgi:hypothetical protein